MNRARYTRLLANLNYKVALAVSNSGDMLEIEDQPAEVTQEEVLRFTDDIRKTLLWIERASAGVN